MALVVVLALVFTFTNGFHDTFDQISTAVSTKAMPPHAAVAVAAVLNFLGAFIGVAVAATIAQDIIDSGAIAPVVVVAGLAGGLVWNIATWWRGLPSSSSHALIGGLLGAAIAAAGADSIIGGGLLDKILIPALVAPLVAFLLAIVSIVLFYRLFGSRRPGPISRAFRRAELLSSGVLALGHGANDGQKAMGVIALALIANGSLGADADPPLWAIVSCAAAIAAGTYAGGLWTMRGRRAASIEMDAAQAFSAQGGGAATLLVATLLGFPISSTHAISSGVMGAGAAKRLSAVRWGVAGNIVVAWLLTLPAAAAIGAAAYGIAWLFGA